jgi:hypothetical protein
MVKDAIFFLSPVFLAGICAGVWVFRRLSSRERSLRWLAAAFPVVFLCLVVQVATSILSAPFDTWNDIRVARTMALLHSYKLYSGPDPDGPVIGTLHAPVSHLLYLTVGSIKDPTLAILTGSCISFLLVLGPLIWLHLRGRGKSLRVLLLSSYALLACWFVIQQNFDMELPVFDVHTDAAALGFATLAAGILYRSVDRLAWRPLMLSALFAALSLWSKQTMAPLLLALVLFLALADGFARAMRYVLCLLIAGAVVSAMIMAVFWPPKAMLFDILTLAGTQPLKSDGVVLLIHRAYQALRKDGPFALMPAGFLTLNAFFTPRTWRETLASNRWLLFGMVGMFLAPTCFAAFITTGAYVNHLGLVLYFLLVSATIGMCDYFAAAAINENPFMVRASKLLIAILIILNIDPGATFFSLKLWRKMDHNPSQVAYAYALEHRGRAYFPYTPLATLLVEGKLYHLDYALFDREIRGYPLTAAQFRSGIPAGARLIAFPPNTEPLSKAIINLVAGSRWVIEPGLEGWTVFELPL